MPDWVINLLYFLSGLFIALLGIVQNHFYYIKQQQDKFNHINEALEQILERLVALENASFEHRIDQQMRSPSADESTHQLPHLTMREKQVLKLFYGDGLNLKEVAERIGIQTSSLKSHMVALRTRGLVVGGRELTEVGQLMLSKIISEAKTE